MFSRARMLWQATQTIRAQNDIIISLQHERLSGELAYMRIGRDLIEQFLISLDTPENHDVIRERLLVSLGFYRDEIAVREEHVR